MAPSGEHEDLCERVMDLTDDIMGVGSDLRHETGYTVVEAREDLEQIQGELEAIAASRAGD